MSRVSVSIILLVVNLLVAGCASDASEEMEHIRYALDMEGASQQAEEVHLAISEDGHPRLWLEADRLRRYEGDTLWVELTGNEGERSIVGRIFDEEGRRIAVFRARRVIYLERERTFILEHAVEVETVDGQGLATEKLIWEEAKGRLYAPGFVRYRTKTEEIQGYRLQTDERLEHFRMAEVTGQVTIRK